MTKRPFYLVGKNPKEPPVNFSPPSSQPALAGPVESDQTKSMSEITREELKAHLAASEAKTAAVAEQMRADAATLRAELREGHALFQVQGERVQKQLADADARFTSVTEQMRADAATLRADVREANLQLKSQGQLLEAKAVEAGAAAQKFYSEASRLLAEIKLAGEQNKTAMMGMGYKVAAWLFGTILAIGSLSLAVYKAVSAAVT